jgi:hypothetical protein
MGWFFVLCVRCTKPEDALEMRKLMPELDAHTYSGDDRVVTFWTNATSTGIKDQAECDAANEWAVKFYDRLRTCTIPYDWAITGVECDGWVPDEEFVSRMRDNNGLMQGLVVSSDFYHIGGKPDSFVPFSPGYFWFPYTGIIFLED